MSHERNSTESLIAVARAVKVRGLKGEIVAQILTDFPERFENIERMVAVSASGERKTVELESYWFQKDRIILKLAGCDHVDDAREWVGFEFAVPESDRVALPEDHFYHWELEACTVKTVNGDLLGAVKSVMRTGGVEILVVVDDSGKEHLVPMADSIVVRIDTSGKLILIDPPEGLLEL